MHDSQARDRGQGGCARSGIALGIAVGTGIGLFGLFAWSFHARYSLLQSSPYPMGVDGYFYPIQLRSLLDHGQLYYPSSPLCLWFMAPLAMLTDSITGAKLGAALGGALIAFPMYVVGRRVSGSRGAGFLAAALAASSAQSFYLSTEFVKNGFGMTVAVTYLSALAWALAKTTSREHGGASRNAFPWVVVALLLLSTALTHKLALVFALVASVAPLWVAWREARHPVPVVRLLVAIGLVLIAGAIAAVLAPERFVALHDLLLVRDAFRGTWDWSLPVLHVPGGKPLQFQHETAIAGALGLLTLSARCFPSKYLPEFLRRDRSRPSHRQPIPACDRALVLGPALFAVVAALPMLNASDPQGLAFRLRLVCFVPLSVCAAWVAGAFLARWPIRHGQLVLVAFAVAFVIARPTATREGVVVVHPAMQAAMRALEGVVPPDQVIIVPERHLMFMAAWYADTPVRLRPERVPPSRRWRLVPMAYMNTTLSHAVDRARTFAPKKITPPRSLHPGHRNGLVVMPEATWQWISRRLPPRVRRHYERWPTL